MSESRNRRRHAPAGRPRLRLSHRLFLLFLLAGALPIAVVTTVGWLQFQQRVQLWNVPSVESALEASLRSHRRAMDRLQRQLEDLGQTITVDLRFATAAAQRDSVTLRNMLEATLSEPGVDFGMYLERSTRGWVPLALAGSAEAPEVPRGLPDPEASNFGPQRSRPLSLPGDDGDLAAVPSYLWRHTGPDSSATVLGCLLLATRLGQGFFEDLGEASNGLVLYRRFQDVSRVLRTADALLLAAACLVSLAIGLWLARRISQGVSRPVESLVRAMDAVGRGHEEEPPVRSHIPEMEILTEAFTRMRRMLRDYELQLREAEQVRGAQQTARFVAHEIRNALTPVRAGLVVLERRVAELPESSRPQGERALKGIRTESERMATLASAFSDYANLPEPRPESLDAVSLLRDLAEKEAPSEVTCTVRFEPELPQIWADRDEIERMFRNLIKNATEAMGGTGSIEISARVEIDEQTVRFEVVDTGPGMDRKTLEQVFHPGFTTKATGTGLGLALVRGTVIRMGGRISIESEVGAGTRIIIRLPRAAETSTRATGQEAHH